MEDQTIQQAVQDLAVIRRAIETVGKEEGIRNPFAKRAQLMIYGIGLVLAVQLIVLEVFFELDMQWMLAISRHDRAVGIEGLAEVALGMPFLLAAIYFLVWRSAKHDQSQLSVFLARNFQYLRNMNFLSDIFVKFVVLSLAVLSGHGEWVPALLSLFLGDYLLQGRFFTLPMRASIVLGPLCFAGAGLLYAKSSTNIVIPLAIFAGLCALNIATLTLRGKGRV